MGRLWEWLWDRHGRHYSWAVIVAVIPTLVLTYSFYAVIIVAFEHSHRYGEAIAVVVAAATAIETSPSSSVDDGKITEGQHAINSATAATTGAAIGDPTPNRNLIHLPPILPECVVTSVAAVCRARSSIRNPQDFV